MQINFSGPINKLGYGIVSTNLFYEIARQNPETSLWPIGGQYQDHETKFTKMINKGVGRESYRAGLSFRHFHQFDMATHIGRGPHVGSTVFELDKLKDEEVRHLNSCDLVCVPTGWHQNVLSENGVHSESYVLPHGVDRAIFNESVSSATARNLISNRIGPNTTIFLNVGKIERRKGHDKLVEIFNKAFLPNDDVALVMLWANPFLGPHPQIQKQWDDLYNKSPLANKIILMNNRLPFQGDVASFMSLADCGVFPSRSEGWGLESFEMLSMGKKIILTDYAGHTGYATNENSLLVQIDQKEIASDGFWFNGFGQWAHLGQNQIDQFIVHMRNIHKEKKENGRIESNLVGINTCTDLSWPNIVTNLISKLETLK